MNLLFMKLSVLGPNKTFQKSGMPFWGGKKRLRHAPGHQKLENTIYFEMSQNLTPG